MYCIRRLYKGDDYVNDMIKSINVKFYHKDNLVNSLLNNRCVYRSKFGISKDIQGNGFGYSMHLESLKKENLPENTEYVLLYVRPENIIA